MQAGPAEYKLALTYIGVEGTTGLGGGNQEAKTLTEFKVAGKVGPAEASVKVGAQLSSVGGPSAGISASGTLGAKGAALGGTIGLDGAKPVIKAKANTKIGVEANIGLGVGVGVNVSQMGRANNRAAESARALAAAAAAYLKKVIPVLPF